MSKFPVKVLLVEDSPIALEILKRVLTSSPEVQLVGTARNGTEALKLVPKVEPAVICTDLYMKGMDGLELTKQVMANYPRPILVVSNAVQKDDTQNTFELLQAGAVDVFPKPNSGAASDYERVKQQLIDKIKVLSGVKVFTRSARHISSYETASSSPKATASVPRLSVSTRSKNVTSKIEVVTIGSSTGGPKALHKILAPLPGDFPVPIICTQHISIGFLKGLVEWLSLECQLAVKIAEVGEKPLPGTVYFAPDRHHLELNSQGKFVYSRFEPIDGHCPSVTVMFKSVAQYYGKGTASILLTGMGRDGAAGMLAIAEAGGTTVAQDERSCVVFGMPKEAIALGAAAQVLPLHEIAPWLLKVV